MPTKETKFQTEYNNLITEAKSKKWARASAGCYVEKHHIIPICFGDSNNIENLVYLTAQETS